MAQRLVGFIFSSLIAFGCGLIANTLTNLYLRIPYFYNGQEFAPPFANFELISRILFIGLGSLFGFLFGTMLFHRTVDFGKNLRRIPAEDKIACTFGTIFALILSYIAGIVIVKIGIGDSMVTGALILLVTVLFIWGCNVFALSMKEELKFLMPGAANRAMSGGGGPGNSPKLLDTNIIIDGRIHDITRTGFLEGPLILPGFVLEELQHIADSADALRRNRGRRGLDILHQMQTELEDVLRIVDRYKINFAHGDGVDVKLVKLAKAMSCDIVTNDFNLNKVAKLYGVRVLNINELANAVKPVVLPGEELTVTIIKEGKEFNQGVGYLDDGTMIVVENGKKMMGDVVTVAVSSVLQTVAGKMIFAEVKFAHEQEDSDEHSHYYSGRGNRRKTY